MAVRHSGQKEEEAKPVSVALVVSELVVHHSGTATLTGGPPDADVVFQVSSVPPGGPQFVQTAHTDETGTASVEVVPPAVSNLAISVSHTVASVLAEATATVSGSPAPIELTLTALEPTEAVVGPPDSVTLVATGTGFDQNTRMSFGVFSAEEAEAGLGEEGEPKWEATTRMLSRTEVSIVISQGLFPNADPDVPVYVGGPDGARAGPLGFAFVEPPPEEIPEPPPEEENT